MHVTSFLVRPNLSLDALFKLYHHHNSIDLIFPSRSHIGNADEIGLTTTKYTRLASSTRETTFLLLFPQTRSSHGNPEITLCSEQDYILLPVLGIPLGFVCHWLVSRNRNSSDSIQADSVIKVEASK